MFVLFVVLLISVKKDNLTECLKLTLGPVDPMSDFVKEVYGKDLSLDDFKTKLNEAMTQNAVYLRPETAQAMFVQFLNVQQSSSLKIPFGIAQQGKSFRNEILVEHFIFRSCEFEQMEMEFFVEPGTQIEWLNYWKDTRLNWYKTYANLQKSLCFVVTIKTS